VRSVSSRDGVSFPNIHLGAACANFACSGVGVALRGVPAFDVGLAIDELDVVRALRVTVSSSVLGTSLVVSFADTTVSCHLDEVKSTVEATGELGDIDVEGELLAHEVEHLVLGV
jgi:hypothetical protein